YRNHRSCTNRYRCSRLDMFVETKEKIEEKEERRREHDKRPYCEGQKNNDETVNLLGGNTGWSKDHNFSQSGKRHDTVVQTLLVLSTIVLLFTINTCTFHRYT